MVSLQLALCVAILAILVQLPGNAARIITAYGHRYQYFIDMRDKTWVSFKVQTSRDAIVGLFNRTQLTYEIVIGGGNNTFACIRKTHAENTLQTTHVRGLVSAYEPRPFWISWQNNIISYGKGHQRYNGTIGVYHDTQPSTVDYMKISSYGYNRVMWIIPEVYFIQRILYGVLPTAVMNDSILLVYPNGANNVYGNSVIRRYSLTSANYVFSSWINTITTLTSGILKNFYLFVYRRNNYPSLKRLQIWRKVSLYRYKLIWERIANFTGAHRYAVYKFDVSENNFEVADGDYIGWVNEDNNTWISASACVPARCQCSRSYYFWRSYNWPVPNRNSTFSCYRQYNFSVAVDIQPLLVKSSSSPRPTTTEPVCPRNVNIEPKNRYEAHDKVTCTADSYPEAQYVWIDHTRNDELTYSQTFILLPGKFNLTCIAYSNSTCSRQNQICQQPDSLAWRRRDDRYFPASLFNITDVFIDGREYCAANETISGTTVAGGTPPTESISLLYIIIASVAGVAVIIITALVIALVCCYRRRKKVSESMSQSVTEADTRYISQDAQIPGMPSSRVEGDDDYDVIDDLAVSGYERLDKTTNPSYTGPGKRQTAVTPSSREYVGMKKLDADNNHHNATAQANRRGKERYGKGELEPRRGPSQTPHRDARLAVQDSSPSDEVPRRRYGDDTEMSDQHDYMSVIDDPDNANQK